MNRLLLTDSFDLGIEVFYDSTNSYVRHPKQVFILIEEIHNISVIGRLIQLKNFQRPFHQSFKNALRTQTKTRNTSESEGLNVFLNVIIIRMKPARPHIESPVDRNLSGVSISSARYSDISSEYFRAANQNQATPLKSLAILNSPQQKQPRIELWEINDIRAEGKQLGQYFYEEDSLLQQDRIFPEPEFRAIAKQLKIDPVDRQSIVHKFYRRAQPPSAAYSPVSKYYIQYLQWKQKPDEIPAVPMPEQRAQVQHCEKAEQNAKQLQLLKYKQFLHRQNQENSSQEAKRRLENISQQYHSKLQAVLNTDASLISSQQRTIHKPRQLGFGKLEYPSITVHKAEGQARRQNEQRRIWQQLKQKSFKDLVKNPPRGREPNLTIDLKPCKKNEQIVDMKPTRQWKLDVDQIVKMPARQFLLFYDHYKTKITALCSPEQMKIIKRYRQKALDKQEALQKLRVKVSQAGPQLMAKLSRQKKDQLFQLLYEKELEKETENQPDPMNDSFN